MSGETTVELTLEADGHSLAGRLTLPLRVRVQGVEAILVSAEAFDSLSRSAGRSVGARSRIERDHEVQQFVDERATELELAILRDAIRERFGAERTPSVSALHRYVMGRRQAAQAVSQPAKGRRVPRRTG